MATQREIKARISFTTSMKKNTSALQLVSTVKSKKAVNELSQYKDFYKEVEEIMGLIFYDQDMEKTNWKNTLYIVFVSDMGLCGGYNHNVLKTLLRVVGAKDELIIIGNKGINYGSMTKAKVLENIKLSHAKSSDKVIENIIKIINNNIADSKKVKVIFTEYVSQLKQIPKVTSIYPVEIDREKISKQKIRNIEFEPNKSLLLKQVMGIYYETMLISFLKECDASEHTSRRIAMENANQKYDDLLKELRIKFNRTRQAKITQEINEIVGGAEAQN